MVRGGTRSASTRAPVANRVQSDRAAVQPRAATTGARIWDAERGELRHRCAATAGPGRGCGSAANGAMIAASWGNDGRCASGSPRTGRCCGRSGATTTSWARAVFAQTEPIHRNGGQRGPDLLWNLTGATCATENVETRHVWAASRPEGRVLATPTTDNTVRFGFRTRRMIITWPRQGQVRSIDFSPDGATLATGARTAWSVWDAQERRVC